MVFYDLSFSEGCLKPVSTSFFGMFFCYLGRAILGLCLVGVSPEFELALYTMAFLQGNEDNACVLDNQYRLNIKCYSIGAGAGRKIGTAFPEAL
jgi:hypothetical protein